MLKKREELQTVTWVVVVPAKGSFFTLVQAASAADARKLARDADDWFTTDDLEPGEVLDTSKAFPDSGLYQRAADEAAESDEGEPDDSE